MSYPFTITSTPYTQPQVSIVSAQNTKVEPALVLFRPALEVIIRQNQSFSSTTHKRVAAVQADACNTTTAQYPHSIFKTLIEKEIFKDIPNFPKQTPKVCKATSQYRDSEFEELQLSPKRLKSVDGIQQKFRKQNRYQDIILADEWLFRLSDPQGMLPFENWKLQLMSWDEMDDFNNDCPFINASRIGDHGGDIITQAPISNAKVSFWQMVWKTNASVIVMLTPFLEGSRSKCSKYFPRYPNKKISLAEHACTIYVHYHQKLERNGFINWEVFLERNSHKRPISIVQCEDWKDHAPYPADKLIWLVKYIAGLTKGKPIITHCSAGIGRSGAFYACYLIYLFRLQNEGGVQVDVLQFVKYLRQFRPGLVQTREQYELIFAFIKALDSEVAAS